MRDDDYDDEDDDRGPADRPAFPGIVRLAGIIWIGVGALELLNAAANVVLAGMNQNQNPGTAGGACCAVGVGIAFLVCGIQTVTGKAKDTLGNSIGSLVLGALILGLAALIGFGGAVLGANPNANANGIAPGVFIAIAVFTGLMGLTLLLAGVLALMGRRQYQEWREANTPRKRRRARRRDDEEEDDDDDRPRRRRDDDDED